MANRSKQKGSRAERELVKLLATPLRVVRRAWGSDGRSMGLPEGVDVVVTSFESQAHLDRDMGAREYLQVKSRKALPQWLQIPEGCDAVAIKIDRDGWYLLQRLDDAL